MYIIHCGPGQHESERKMYWALAPTHLEVKKNSEKRETHHKRNGVVLLYASVRFHISG